MCTILVTISVLDCNLLEDELFGQISHVSGKGQNCAAMHNLDAFYLYVKRGLRRFVLIEVPGVGGLSTSTLS